MKSTIKKTHTVKKNLTAKRIQTNKDGLKKNEQTGKCYMKTNKECTNKEYLKNGKMENLSATSPAMRRVPVIVYQE